MAKGFIRGILWGACVSFGGITLLSVADNRPERSVVGQADIARVPQSQAPSGPVGSNAQPVSGDFAGDPATPTPDTLANLAPDVDAPAAIPEAGLVTSLEPSDLPAADPQQGLAAVDTQAPDVTRPNNTGLTTPSTEPGVLVSTDPAQPPAPEPVPQQTAFDDDASEESGPASPQLAALPEASVAAPVVDDSDPADMAAAVADPIQPILPTVIENLGNSGVGRELETPSLMVVQTPSALPQTTDIVAPSPDIVTAALPQTDTKTVVVDKDASSEPPTEPVATSPEVIEKAPELVTEVKTPDEADLPLREVAALDVSQEPVAPTLETAESLEIPSNADPVQTAGESDTAAVSATVSLDDPTVASADVSTVAEIATEAPAPVLAPEPVAVAQAERDAVAEPDQAEYVASASDKSSEAPAPKVQVNRLPTLSDPAPIEDPQVEAETAPIAGVQSADLTPFERNAEVFDNPENKPLMSIILIDDGVDLAADKIGLSALADFPYPISFAVNPLSEDVDARAQAYRSNGFEVLALVDLPQNATAQDAEVNLAVALERLPQAVAVMEGVETGVQTTRESGRQVAKILAETGHGFVTQNQGLNTVQKLAAKEAVPSAVIFRDFDSKGQNATVIRRFLDQAAFRAAQEDGVVMVGRLREETVAALLLWSLQDRASKISMAPVSAVLKTTPGS